MHYFSNFFKAIILISIGFLVGNTAAQGKESVAYLHTLKENLSTSSNKKDSLHSLIALGFYYQDNRKDSAIYYRSAADKIAASFYTKIVNKQLFVLRFNEQLLFENLDSVPKNILQFKEKQLVEKDTLYYLKAVGLEADVNALLQNYQLNLTLIETTLAQFSNVNSSEIAGLYLKLARVYLAKQDLESARIFNEKALEMYRKVGNKIGVNNAYRAIAYIYLHFLDIENGIAHVNKGMVAIGALASSRSLSRDNLAKGMMHCLAGEFKESLAYLDLALFYNKNLENANAEEIIFRYWLGATMDLGNYQQAINKAKEHLKETTNQRIAYVLNFSLVKSYMRKGDLENAALYLTIIDAKIDSKTFELNNLDLMEYLEQASFLAYKLGAYQNAYKYLSKFTELNNEYTKNLDAETIIKNQAKFQLQEKELELKDAYQENLELQQKSKERNALLIIVIIGSITFISILFLLRQISDKNKKLKENNRIILLNKKFLEENNRTIKKTFSMISHDLRAPFNAILGLSKYLISQIAQLTREEVKENLIFIEKAAQNNFHLTQKLLTWSVGQHNGFVVDKQKHNIAETINQAISVNKHVLHEKNLQIVNNAVQRHFLYDEEIILNILNNLISNAVRHSNRDGVIYIKATIVKNKLYIEVEDQGVGMDAITLEKLNKQFDKNDMVLMNFKNNNVSGYGIALSKELIALHDGKLFFKSTINQGTTAIIENCC